MYYIRCERCDHMPGYFNLHEEYLDLHILEDVILEHKASFTRASVPPRGIKWLVRLKCTNLKNAWYKIEKGNNFYSISLRVHNRDCHPLTFSDFESLCAATQEAIKSDCIHV